MELQGGVWGEDAADCYAEIRHQLVSTGRAMGELDMMIAGALPGSGGGAGDE